MVRLESEMAMQQNQRRMVRSTAVRVRAATIGGLALIAAVGCKSKSIVLGHGEVDSGAMPTSRETDRDSTMPLSSTSLEGDVSSQVPKPTPPTESSFALPNSASSESSGERSGAQREAGTEPTGDMCEQAYATCRESNVPDSVCMTVLIDCRTALPDGGPPCQEVFTRCVDMGYPEQDCDRAATVCAEGGDYQLLPFVDASLWADTSSR